MARYWPQDLVTVSLCIQIAIDKMQLCLLSAYACLYHNPTATMGQHSQWWRFIVPSTTCTCVMIMLFNQLLDMPHMSGGCLILAKDKCSPTGM